MIGAFGLIFAFIAVLSILSGNINESLFSGCISVYCFIAKVMEERE